MFKELSWEDIIVSLAHKNNLTNRNLILTNCDETKKKENIKPSIKNINMIEFFKKNKTVYIPEPLVIEQCQRPKGPFCQQ